MTLLYPRAELDAAIAAPRAWAAERGLVFEGDWDAWAVFDTQREFRYLLGRRWALEQPMVSWIMLNPSTASATADDPTIRKVRGFSRGKTLNAGGFIVANLASLRSTDPKTLAKHRSPVGEHTLAAIELAVSLTLPTVVAWGRFPSKKVAAELAGSVRSVSQHPSLCCLGKTHGHEPRHPLMLAYSTALETWP